MRYVKTGSSAQFTLEAQIGDDIVVPDSGSITITVSKPDGTVLLSEALSDSTDGLIPVTISSTHNSKTLPYEYREVKINFQVDNKPYEINQPYRIVDRVFLPVSPSDVRDLMGISVDEWGDEKIDIVGSYESIRIELEASSIDSEDILNNGSEFMPNVLNAVRYKAALDILPALELIAVQSQQADNVAFKRFDKIDFAALKSSIYSAYADQFAILLVSTEVDLVYATTGLGTDAVTGV